jgi:ABC-type transport system involved in cytochrome bd biosynthesis fused ATPase/permease subunit
LTKEKQKKINKTNHTGLNQSLISNKSLIDESFNNRNTILNENNQSFIDHLENKNFKLNALNISIQPGQLVMIIGQVGSGKTSIFQAILGEMRIKHQR